MLRHPRPTLAALLGVLAALACSDSSGPSEPPPSPVVTTITAVEGAGLQAPAGTVLPAGPTVEVRDQGGALMKGQRVGFQVLEGGGTAVITTVETDASGRARGLWILGTSAGTPQRLKASVGSLTLEFQAQAVEGAPGQKYSGRGGYVDYYPGTLPLVLSAPHGGELRPSEIPDRSWGETGRDTNTLDLALQIRTAVYQRTGAYPHLVLSNLHRIKLDPNREIVEAAQDDAEAERAWWEYHIFADRAGGLVEDQYGEGFHIDLHGHGHAIARLELGYLLTASDLSLPDDALNAITYVNKSSVKVLAGRPGNTLAGLLRGPTSLGTLLEARSYPSVPSQDQSGPGADPYFNGGYSTVRHGSRDFGKVSGVQIEHHYAGVRDTAANRQAYAQALVDALMVYFPAHFGFALAPRAPAW